MGREEDSNVADMGLIDLTLKKHDVKAARKVVRNILKIYNAGMQHPNYPYYQSELVGASCDDIEHLNSFLLSTQNVDGGE